MVATFDHRFKGHVDGWLHLPGNGTSLEAERVLVEIKSTYDEKLERIRAERRLPREVFYQVQMYLEHGRFRRGLVVYVARNTGRLYVHEATPQPRVISELNEKAARVLAEVDRLRADYSPAAVEREEVKG